MKRVIVGHRGTGKTELLRRLRLYARDEESAVIDLDGEIEKKIGKGIRELFLEHGEAYFREMERQVFLEMLQQPYKNITIVLGAGFDLSVVPESVNVLWVKRRTDRDGRIFLNRPRLEPDLSPLEEFYRRAQVREKNYREHADEVYLMPEGIFENHHKAMDIEKKILLHQLQQIGGALTVLPEMFKTPRRWQDFVNRFSQRGVDFFELRDDLLSPAQITQALTDLASEKFIFSLRRRPYDETYFTGDFFKSCAAKATWVDWAWELGSSEEVLGHIPSDKLILSLHNAEHFDAAAALENRVGHFKFAPEVPDFKTLMNFHRWQNAQSNRRSFLPRSESGRWTWYRLLQKEKQLINFIKEDDGSAPDQPSLWAWMMTPSEPQNFAAVLGDPVYHSYTPLEHSDFFAKKNTPVLAVQISRAEWDEAFPHLQSLGLTHAAVTAPHKENAGKLLGSSHAPVNTLFWDSKTKQWTGISTDEQGFLDLIEGIGMIAPLQHEIFVWGGGGTLGMLKKSLPHASYFSSRTGTPRQGSEEALNLNPKIVIWAAPRGPETVMPPSSWNPAMVYDLNYKDDSLGREYAQGCGANYQSGLVMFTTQAQGQRLFWRNKEEQT